MGQQHDQPAVTSDPDESAVTFDDAADPPGGVDGHEPVPESAIRALGLSDEEGP